MSANDEAAVLDFGSGHDSGLSHSRLLQDFTSHQSLLTLALDQLSASGSTPLYGSIQDGLDLLLTRLAGSGGTLVVMTDGQASDSFLMNSVISRAVNQQTEVYPVGLGQNIDFAELIILANATGGTFAQAADSDSLQQAFAGIGLAATVGRTTVSADCTYSQVNPGTYQVVGELVVDAANGQIVHPFSFGAVVNP